MSDSYDGPTDPPQEITCDLIRRACEHDGKSFAVLVSVDMASQTTQFTTWGRAPADKVAASDLADHLAEELCPSAPETVFESYKLDAAKNKAEVERLTAEVARLQAFKDYAHARLDAAGIPTHPGGPHSKEGCRVGRAGIPTLPGGPHSKEGCRVGDRLDMVLAHLPASDGGVPVTPGWLAVEWGFAHFAEGPCRREMPDGSMLFWHPGIAKFRWSYSDSDRDPVVGLPPNQTRDEARRLFAVLGIAPTEAR